MHRILIVEDDVNFGAVLADYLRMQQYHVTLEVNGNLALERLREESFDLCILDVMMPEMDGFTLAGFMVKLHPELLFVYLTAKHLKEDIMQGYRVGAADYLVKPFDTEILLLKMKALLQRSAMVASNVESWKIGMFQFHSRHRSLSSAAHQYRLSPKCAQLLEMLVQKQNQLLSREQVLMQIWKDNNYFTARSMDVYINRLRQYFSEDPNIRITNIHGQGYILEVG
jgi:two-component system OmpR family response regulator